MAPGKNALLLIGTCGTYSKMQKVYIYNWETKG